MTSLVRSYSVLALLFVHGGCTQPMTVSGGQSATRDPQATTDGAETDGDASTTSSVDEDTQAGSSSGGLPSSDCSDVITQSTYCITQEQDMLMMQGLDDGSVCTFAPYETGQMGIASVTLAMFEDTVVQCIDGTVQLRTLSTQDNLDTGVSCISVAQFGSGVAVRSPTEGIVTYASLDDLRSGTVDATYPRPAVTPSPGPGSNAERIALWGTTMYFAFHDTDRVQRFDLETGENLGDIILEVHHELIMGLSVVDEDIYNMHWLGPEYGDRFGDNMWERYDTEGTLLDTGRMPVGVNTLHCS